MKILQISPTYSGIGGIAQHVRGLEKYLTNTGNDVDILSSDNSFTLPIKGLKNPSFMLSSSVKTRFMKKHDIIHAHNIPSAKAMKNAKGKKILTIHGIFSEQIDILHGKTTANISKKYEINALESADAITVVSKDAKEYYSKLGFNVHHIPNAIDIDSLPKNENKMFDNQIIFVGRLSKEKGILKLLSISKELPKEIHLIIVGIGPEENNVKIASKQKNIHYLGYLPPEKTIPLIRGSKILVQPSLVEGISSTILESMACQTSIIASNVGGNSELIKNNENGILMDTQNSDSLLEQIISLIDNKELRKSFENKSLKFVEKYDWNKIGENYLKIYKSLLD